MKSIFLKEISSFFSSLTAYIVIGVFLILIGSFTWIFNETSIISSNYAGLDPLFAFAPLVFLFLIPAVTMRSFSEEYQNGTIEVLSTKPIHDWQIVFAKFFANVSLVSLAILPTLVYYYSVYKLGSPIGNLDSGGILGSYIGLLFLVCLFVAVGLLASSLTSNQIVSFILAAFISFVLYFGFEFIAEFPSFVGSWDDIIDKIGASHYYSSLSRGVLDTRDILYFISVVGLTLFATISSLQVRRLN